MRVLVSGDRNWRDAEYIFSILDDVDRLYGIDVVIEGCARGADELAGYHPEQVRGKRTIPAGWAYQRGKDYAHYPAYWDMYGKAAGPIRNRYMLTEGKPDMVLAFHPSLNTSKGTKDMVEAARKAGVPVHVFPHHTVDVEHIAEDGEWWLDALKSGAVI